MSTVGQPDESVAKNPPLPTGLLIATILVAGQSAVRLYFLISALVRANGDVLSSPQFLFFSLLVPAIMFILTVVMVILIFVRLPAAKPYGITVCSLNVLLQLYTVGTLLVRFGVTNNMLFAYGVNLIYIAIFTTEFFCLIAWPIHAADSSNIPAPEASYASAATSHKGMAQASLICAICGPLLLVILGPIALILGLVARKNMRASGNFEGQGMALAGVIIGSIETGISVLALLLAFAIRH